MLLESAVFELTKAEYKQGNDEESESSNKQFTPSKKNVNIYQSDESLNRSMTGFEQ